MLKQVATLAVALLALSSCGREERSRTASQSAPRASSAAASRTAASRSNGAAERREGIAAQLATEAATRPSGTVTVEDMVAALETAGDPAVHEQQVLASPVDARYCAVLETRSGAVISLCEFDSPAAAQTGLEVSRSRFDRLIPGRRFALNASTLMTVPPQGEAATDPSGPARELFAALSPHMQGGKEK
jgi:hypothetical protein